MDGVQNFAEVVKYACYDITSSLGEKTISAIFPDNMQCGTEPAVEGETAKNWLRQLDS